MQHNIASKLTSRLLSSSTAIRSRANSFSDWAEKKTKNSMSWSEPHFETRGDRYLDLSCTDKILFLYSTSLKSVFSK